MIQGVIDLCFLEDGQWVLADYKTDDADGETLMRWYARALGDITGIPVKEAWLFGLRAGESYPVALADEGDFGSEKDHSFKILTQIDQADPKHESAN